MTDEALDTQLKPALANVTSWSRWHRRGPGPNDIRVTLTTSDGQPVRPIELHVAVGQPEAGIEPLQREAEPNGPSCGVARIVLPAAGAWRIQVEALISDFSKIHAAVDVHIH